MSDTSDIQRLVPNPDRDSEEWWEALARHEFVLQRCDACQAWRWPPREICNRCGSFDYTWTPVSGRGTIASWVVNQRAFLPGFEIPYVVVNVRLEEQDDCKLIGSWTRIDRLAARWLPGAGGVRRRHRRCHADLVGAG